MKTNLMHYLSSVYFVNQPLHVSGIFLCHHQEVYCLYTAIGVCCGFQLTVCWPYQLYIYSIPPHDRLQICLKHVEVDWRNKMRINSASSWFSLHLCIEMHGQQNIKLNRTKLNWTELKWTELPLFIVLMLLTVKAVNSFYI
jgi:hypothetical protein